ncbi:MAG TPA: TlpA disulfide reductase family protein [Chitinophagaceae bacterium]|nr:TlpA disulfide reductase family protein [Chitinophagaceae bacterium]
MRIVPLLLLLLPGFTAVQSQIPKEAISMEDAAFDGSFASRIMPKIDGKLLNLSKEELKNTHLSYTLVTPFAAKQVTKTVQPSPDGRFSLELDYAFPYQQIWFNADEKFYTSLTVNKDLFLELDMEKIKALKDEDFNNKGVRFMGTDGPMNVYLNNYILFKRSEQMALSKTMQELVFSQQKNADAILSDYNKIFGGIRKIAQEYITLNPSAYGWIIENEVQSGYYSNLLPLYWNKLMNDSLWQQLKQHKSYLVSNDGAGFYNYLYTYVQYIPTNPRQISLTQTAHRLDSLFPPSKADFLKLCASSQKNLQDQKESLGYLVNNMQTNWCKTVLQSEYTRTVAKIDQANQLLSKSADGTAPVTDFGKPILQTVFGASMYEISNTKAADFLARLKQSFPGKALVLDLWATWCAPCLSEMPHSKKLQQNTKDLPVVFVYLCTSNSSDKDKWKTKVAELQQPGIHFFIDEQLDHELSQLFSFSGYPGYAFIGKDGKYKPGAIQWMSQMDKNKLAGLLR